MSILHEAAHLTALCSIVVVVQDFRVVISRAQRLHPLVPWLLVVRLGLGDHAALHATSHVSASFSVETLCRCSALAGVLLLNGPFVCQSLTGLSLHPRVDLRGDKDLFLGLVALVRFDDSHDVF